MLERIKRIINEERLDSFITAIFQYGDWVKLLANGDETLYANNELWSEDELRKNLIQDTKTKFFIKRNYGA